MDNLKCGKHVCYNWFKVLWWRKYDGLVQRVISPTYTAKSYYFVCWFLNNLSDFWKILSWKFGHSLYSFVRYLWRAGLPKSSLSILFGCLAKGVSAKASKIKISDKLTNFQKKWPLFYQIIILFAYKHLEVVVIDLTTTF